MGRPRRRLELIGNPRDPTLTEKLTDSLYLTNLALDPSEKTNLAGGHPDVVERLMGLRAAWLERGAGKNG